MASRLHRRSAIVLAAGLATVLLAGACITASAQGRLDARYTATLAGIPIGKGAWVIDIGEGRYVAAASGVTAGLMRVFSQGQGTGAARGAIVDGEFIPSSYAASIVANDKRQEVRMALSDGTVKDFAVSPPNPPDPARVPLTDAHRHGVIDPMTASLFHVPNHGNPLVPESCQRKLSVFDGRMRYDLQLTYKRTDWVKAEKGYEGPVLVCSVYFSPIAGYIPDRSAIKYLIRMRDMEVWLAPITGASVLVPFRFSMPTPLGKGVVQATQFLSVSRAAQMAPAIAKSQ